MFGQLDLGAQMLEPKQRKGTSADRPTVDKHVLYIKKDFTRDIWMQNPEKDLQELFWKLKHHINHQLFLNSKVLTQLRKDSHPYRKQIHPISLRLSILSILFIPLLRVRVDPWNVDGWGGPISLVLTQAMLGNTNQRITLTWGWLNGAWENTNWNLFLNDSPWYL